MLTLEDIKDKYEYHGDSILIYKYDSSKGGDWNNRFNGKEVKPLLSAGKKYIFCKNDLYSLDQVIFCLEKGENIRFTKYNVTDLVKVEKRILNLFRSYSTADILKVKQRLENGGKIEDEFSRLKGEFREEKVAVKKVYVKKGLEERFNKGNVEYNSKNGLPKHIYKDQRGSIFVEVQHEKKCFKKKGFESVEDAINVRNKIYDDILNGVAKGCSFYNESSKR